MNKVKRELVMESLQNEKEQIKYTFSIILYKLILKVTQSKHVY